MSHDQRPEAAAAGARAPCGARLRTYGLWWGERRTREDTATA